MLPLKQCELLESAKQTVYVASVQNINSTKNVLYFTTQQHQVITKIIESKQNEILSSKPSWGLTPKQC